jgi:uncharacterized protein involved in outer membrane biogenesis
MKKIILWSIGILVVVLILVTVLVAGGALDKVVKTGVVTVGPKIVKVPITLDEVKLSLLTGSATVKGLVVGNPEGYKTPFAISVGTASVGVNPFSVFSDKIVVRSIVVQSPEITFEGGISENNLGKIMDNVNSVAQSGGPATTNKTASAKPAKKIEVDDFLITGAKVHVSLTGFGGKEMTLALPDIHLTNLGKGTDGLTPTDLTRAVLQAITSGTAKAVIAGAADLGKGVENLGKDAGKSVGAGVDKLKQGIGGLFGK